MNYEFLTKKNKDMEKRILAFAVMTFMATIMWGKDIKTATFTTNPQMHCVSCETKIKNNMRFEKGVKRIETNVDKQTIVITYDADKTNVEQLIKGFAKIKYEARVVTTDNEKK